MGKQSAQIKCSSSIFDASSFINKMIGVVLYIMLSFHTITVHSSAKVTPFFAYTKRDPRWCLLEIRIVSLNPSAEQHLHQLQQTHLELSTHLKEAQEIYKFNANRHRLPSPFKVSDRVWLLSHHMKTTRPCDKLDYQWLDPFVIIARINDATFRLDLPPHLQIHPVFHSSLLEPCRTSSISNRVVAPPPSI